MKKIIIISILLVGLFIVGCAKEVSDFPPAPAAPGESSAKDGGGAFAGQVYSAGLEAEGYANPLPNFIIFDEKDIYHFGETLEGKVQNEDLVWGIGKILDKNDEWQEFEFEGDKVTDPEGNVWIKGEASNITEILPDYFSPDVDNTVLAYACSFDGEWDCHGGFWMAHEWYFEGCQVDADCAGLCIDNTCVDFAAAPEAVGEAESECEEDYYMRNNNVLTTYYQNYYGDNYNDYYVCELDNNLKEAVGLSCPSGWNEPFYNGLYRYVCQVIHSDATPPNSPASGDVGCSSGYVHSGVFTKEPIYEDEDYSSSINCMKEGDRPANSPCSLGFQPHTLYNVVDGYVICVK